MTHTAVCPGIARVLVAAAALACAVPVSAGLPQRPPTPSSSLSSGRPPAVQQPAVQQNDQGRRESAPAPGINVDGARETRQQLDEVLGRYPPALGQVLKLDQSLLGNKDYLAPYPVLMAFLDQHPEVVRNPAYFLENVNSSNSAYYNTPQWRQRQELFGVLAGFAAFIAFLVFIGVIIWIIRLIVAHRRWNRLSKVQYEVHSKLLDRFTSNEDLLAYIQSPAGRRFLESAPLPLQDAPRSMAAPFSRILWSVQAGVVLAITGVGLLWVSTRFFDEPAQFFMVVGVLTLALGGGFIISAGAAYVLSRRMGLLDPPPTDHA